MKIHVHSCSYTFSDKLLGVFNQALLENSLNETTGFTLHFRDPGYGPETGGFHPVEVGFSAQGYLLYITDFAYVGTQPFVELAKDLDFDFQCACFQQFGRDYPITEGADLFDLWQHNFLQYYAMGVYETSVQGA